MFNFLKKKELTLKAPLSGELVNINNVPDEAFAQKMIGDGIAIKPVNNCLISPVDGVIIKKFSTNHALGIEIKEGLEILLHMGIDTVDLKGRGFEAHIEEGQQVKIGQKLLTVNWDIIAKKAASIISPIVITNMEMVKKIEYLVEGFIETGQELFVVHF